ncbi:MAG: HAMP domain-containing histidine kinase [Actinomycetota bacterium]|nr:HAMP domain-containing histidine kinase [Actinomycetota bacterium]
MAGPGNSERHRRVPGRLPSWGRAGIRWRTTLGAVLVVGIALALGGILLVLGVHRSLVQNLDTASRQRAADVASLIRAGALPTALAGNTEDGSLVQVVGPDGAVLASSANITGNEAISALRPAGSDTTLRTTDTLPIGGGESFRLFALAVPAPGGSVVVYVARSLAPVTETTTVIGLLLAAGLPLLLAIVFATTWVVTGRALAPVEAVRARVAAITAADLTARVPEPAATDEVGRLARTMNQMLARLEGSSTRHQRFVSDASHELRSPLASQRTQAEVALAHPARADWPATVRGLLAETKRMAGLVEDLLLLTRADERGITLSRAEVDLEDLVLAEAARLRREGRSEVRLGVVQPTRLRGDRSQLRRLLRNLADNADRHAERLVTFDLTHNATEATVVVTDDGAGIAPRDRDVVFDRFVRLDDARARDAGGSGLGLPIAREIVTAYGGRIRITDPPGTVGARFEVTLPI